MSPELDDTLRMIVQRLRADKTNYPNRNTQDAIQAVINAIVSTIMQMTEPKP